MAKLLFCKAEFGIFAKNEAIMEKILIKSTRKIHDVSQTFKRYLYDEINLNNRQISLLGSRGVGKTTLLLQIAAKHPEISSLYVALDDLFFTENTLYSLAETFEKQGGELLLLDEVHKYPNWSRELKLIYDDFPGLNIIFSSSSILNVYKGESDLSRRTISYTLKEMSFREYLQFQHDIELPKFSLQTILSNHEAISYELVGKFKPLKFFSDYLKYGSFPFYGGNEIEYYQQTRNIINLIIELDLLTVKAFDYTSIAKLKRLLYVLSVNVPFTPNISKLSEKVGLTRNAAIEALDLLKRAELIQMLYKKTRSISALNKPDKIWLHNTNYIYALSEGKPETGNLRESFFLSQLSHLHQLTLPEKGDFLIDDKYIFEIGGKSKTQKQIAGLDNAFIVKDDIETGIKNSIPLWMFGLMY
jgi:predicted AAA+ superfamily ATPase